MPHHRREHGLRLRLGLGLTHRFEYLVRAANVNQLSSLMPRASCKVSTQYRLRHVLRNRSMVFGLLPVDFSSLPFDVMSMLNKSCRAQVSNESKGLHAADAIVTWAAGDCSDMVH